MADVDALFRMGVDGGEYAGQIDAAIKAQDRLGVSGGKAAEAMDKTALATSSGAKAMNAGADSAAKLGGGMATASGASSALSGKLAAMLGPLALLAAAVAAMRAAFRFGTESVKEFMAAEDAANRLRSALEGVGQASREGALTQLAGSLQETTRYSDDAITAMQAVAVNIAGARAASDDFTRAAVDLAAVLGGDVSEAGRQLAMTMDGDVGRLGEKIPELEKLTAEQLKAGMAIDVVMAKLGGKAVADVNTFGGSLDQLGNAWKEMKEQMGGALVVAADGEGTMQSLTQAIKDGTPAAREMVTVFASMLTKLGEVETKIMDMNPLFKWAHEKIGEIREGVRIAGFGADAASGKLGPIAGQAAGGGAATGDGAAERAAAAEALRIEKEKADAIEKATKAREKAEAAEKAEAEALRSQVDAMADLVNSAQERDEWMRSVATSTKEADASTQSQADAMRATAASALELGKAHPELREEMQGIASAANATASALESQLATTEELLTMQERGLTLAEAKKQIESDYLFMLRSAQEEADMTSEERATRSAEMAAMESGADAEAIDVTTDISPEVQQMRREADAVEAEIHALQMERIAQRIEAGATLVEALKAENDQLERKGQALINMSAAEEKALKTMEKSAAMLKVKRDIMGMLKDAMRSVVSGFIEMAITGQGSIKQLLGATLKALAVEAGTKAIMALAEGLFLLAKHDPGAAAAFTAAKMYGLVAVAAGAGAAALGGGASEGGAEGGPSGGATARDRDNEPLAERAAPEPRGPGITIVLSGNVTSAGGAAELMRMLQAEADRIGAEAGGRPATVRL